jgi:S-DNA-T family DNA segregation ATPase FtsK/SpoIIIE
VNDHLTITETLGLLHQLKEHQRAFAVREDQWTRAFSRELAAREEASRDEIDRATAAFAAELAKLDAVHRERSDAVDGVFEWRKQRITRAQASLRKQVFDGISLAETAEKHRVQEALLEVRNQRETELAALAARRQEFDDKLAGASRTLELLESNAKRMFRRNRRFDQLATDTAGATAAATADETSLLAQLAQQEAQIQLALRRCRLLFPWLLKFMAVCVGTLLFAAAARGVPATAGAPDHSFPIRDVVIVLLVIGAFAAAREYARRRAAVSATLIAAQLAQARSLQQVCAEKAAARFQQEEQQVQQNSAEAGRRLDQQWKLAVKAALDRRSVDPLKVDEKAERVMARAEGIHRDGIAVIEREHATAAKAIREASEREIARLTSEHTAALDEINRRRDTAWSAIQSDWNALIQPLAARVATANAAAGRAFPSWETFPRNTWTPSPVFENAATLGRLDVSIDQLSEIRPRDPRLSWPGSRTFSTPLTLVYPREGSIVFETNGAGDELAVRVLNQVIFRLLTTLPPGKLDFTVFDPVGLGQNFAALMHLADYEGGQVSRIWTQAEQLEERLEALNDHMEKVIQMYLRNEYATIAEYNSRAGMTAEKYHFLVIGSFPVNCSETAARRLRNILVNGARCGVYVLMHWDRRHPLPQDFIADELHKRAVKLTHAASGFELPGGAIPGARIQFDAPPPPETATWLLGRIGASAREANRVEVPFEQIMPGDSAVWSLDTTAELRVPIGRSGAARLQYLELGQGTRQHVLIAGKTGSGKSTLFHVIITNLALWCSPEQVEFYLVDFKKGVEFKCYASARLPHAKVVAIESDRAFGLSVLQRVDAELRRRGDLFRKAGAQDLAGYKASRGAEPMPRTLLMIDEFQEFFVEDDHVSQSAAVLLDRIVRQGRAFGIHVVLGSQTLGGAYTLARPTMGQMAVRIALQCNEADAYLIMDQDNPAPRLLSRPGEGIYNNAAGAIVGNSPFQTVWLPEKTRDACLTAVRRRADASGTNRGGPFVFEGNVPAEIRENLDLQRVLQAAPATAPSTARAWLGAPNSIKGPSQALFQRQSGSHLLIVGQNDDSARTLMLAAFVALAGQYPAGTARFVFLDNFPPDSPQRDALDRLARTTRHEVLLVKQPDLPAALERLAEEVKNAAPEAGGARLPETFVFLHQLQQCKKLRQDDEFSFSGGGEATSAAAAFLSLVGEGGANGCHFIVSCDTANHVQRFLGRRNLAEFEMRILFQMSVSDSAALIDAPDAGLLGLNRALFYNEREGTLETFRPYAMPDADWLEMASHTLAHRMGEGRGEGQNSDPFH